MDDELPEARVLRLQPGDVLLLTTPQRLTEEDMEYLRAQLKARFGDWPICVFDAGMSVTVARRVGD